MWLSEVYDNSPYQEQGGGGFQVKASEKALQQVLWHISPRALYSMCITKLPFQNQAGMTVEDWLVLTNRADIDENEMVCPTDHHWTLNLRMSKERITWSLHLKICHNQWSLIWNSWTKVKLLTWFNKQYPNGGVTLEQWKEVTLPPKVDCLFSFSRKRWSEFISKHAYLNNTVKE